MTSTALATIEPDLPILADVRGMEAQFEAALPEGVTAKKFVRVVSTAIIASDELRRASRESILRACLKCANDGLQPDGRQAALVVYKGEAQYLPMIAGVLDRIRRSGELFEIDANVVFAKDRFAYSLGDNAKIEHVPTLDVVRGNAVAAYAIAKTKDGGVYREVMSLAEIERVRAVSKAGNKGPWVSWWGEMAKKTVLRRLSKRLPMSADIRQIFERDDDHYDLTAGTPAPVRRRVLHAEFEELPAPDATGSPVTAGEPPMADDTAGAAEAAHAQQEADSAAESAKPEAPERDLLKEAGEFVLSLAEIKTTDALLKAWAPLAKPGGLWTLLKVKHRSMADQLCKAIDDRAAAIEANG